MRSAGNSQSIPEAQLSTDVVTDSALVMMMFLAMKKAPEMGALWVDGESG